MDLIEAQIIDLLNSEVYNKQPKLRYSNQTQWSEILKVAENHSIEPLIYSAVNKYCKGMLESDLHKKWQGETFKQALTMKNCNTKTSKILQNLNDNHIDVIVLKGTYLRLFYPRPDLRIMGDADILIREEDFLKTAEILIHLGYKEIGRNNYHVEYEDKNKHCIEVHWTLEKVEKKVYDLDIWQCAKEIYIDKVKAKTLSLEYTIVYLLDHMAGHLKCLGFGLRQLVDLALLINNTYENIDWNKVKFYIKKAHLERFMEVIFVICNKFFYMSIPKEIDVQDINNNDLEQVIKFIFYSGTYGQMNFEGIYSKKISESKGNMIERNLQLIFPKRCNLKEKFAYGKKNKLFLLIAWCHRAIYLIRRYKINFKLIKNRKNIYEEALCIGGKKNMVLDILQL